MSKKFRSLNAPISFGMVPISEFEWSRSIRSRDNWPIPGEKVPVRLLESIASEVSATRFTSPEGMRPVKIFKLNVRSFRAKRVSNWIGARNQSFRFFKSSNGAWQRNKLFRTLRLVIQHIFDGIVPVKLIWAKERYRWFVREYYLQYCYLRQNRIQDWSTFVDAWDIRHKVGCH